MTRALLMLLVALALSLALTACTAVKPYERELLALPGMSLDPPTPDQHVFESREGSAGAYGSPGSGCGCN
jgi:hypothetical protein